MRIKELKLDDPLYCVAEDTVVTGEIKVVNVDVIHPEFIRTKQHGQINMTGNNRDNSYLYAANGLYYFTDRYDALNKIKENIRTHISVRTKMLVEDLDLIHQMQKEYVVALEEQKILEPPREMPF